MEKNKKKLDKKTIIIIICLVVLVIGVIGGYIGYKCIHEKKIKENSSIDFSSETYKGKEIVVKGNQIIIKEENNSETIETVDLDKKNEFTEATKEIQKLFKIDDIMVKNEAAKTKVTGTVKETSSKYSTAVVTVTFKRNKEVAGVSSAIIDKIEKNKEYNFEISILGDYSDCTYDVAIEYVK